MIVKSCRIVDLGGTSSVFNEDGSPSSLYREALEYTKGNAQQAMKLWSVTKTELWDSQMDGKEDASLKEVLRFIDNLALLNETVTSLSVEEVQSVKTIMKGLGISELSVFTDKMNNLFQPNGYFTINPIRLMKSGMYSSDDISKIDVPKLKDFIARLNIETSVNNFTIVNGYLDTGGLKFKDLTRGVNIIGTQPFITLEEVSQSVAEITDDFSKNGIETALSDTPFAEGALNNKFVDNIFKYLQTKKKVQEFYPTAESKTESIVNNTIIRNTDTVELEESLDFLQDILPDVWVSNQDKVAHVLKDVVQTAKNFNVDIIGLENLTQNQEAVLDIIEATINVLNNPSEENIREFSNIKDSYITPTPSILLKNVNPTYKDYTIVSVSSNQTQDELFENNSLIKVGEELYHQVDRSTTKEEMYEELYSRVVSGEVILYKKYFNNPDLNLKDPVYKGEVLEAISRWINSRNIGVVAPIHGEEISLFQVLFGHTTIEDINDYQPLSGEFSEQYLKTKFVSDFYNHLLTEKLNNSDLYNNILKYFSIGDGDIYFNAPHNIDISGTKFEQELRDYAKLKKEGQIKQFAENTEYVNEDVKILNNPSIASEVEGGSYKVFSDGWLVTKRANTSDYLREGGNLYKKLFNDLDGTVYGLINPNVSNIYNDLDVDFSYDKNIAKSKLNEARKEFSPIITEETNVVGEKIKVSNTIEIPKYSEVELNSVVDNLINEGEVEYTNDEGIPCAKSGMKFEGKSAGKWRLVEDLKGYPSHSRGGVDLEFGDSGVSILRDGGNVRIKAQMGLLIDPPPSATTPSPIAPNTPTPYTPLVVDEMYRMSNKQLSKLHPTDLYNLRTDYYKKAYEGHTYDHTTVGDFSYRLNPTEMDEWRRRQDKIGTITPYTTDIKDIYVPLNADGTPNLESERYYLYPNKPSAPTASTINAWSNTNNVTNNPTPKAPPAYLHPTTGERLDPTKYISPPAGTQIDIQVSQPYLLNSLTRRAVADRELEDNAMRMNNELTKKLTENEKRAIRESKVTPSQYFRKIGISFSDVLSR